MLTIKAPFHDCQSEIKWTVDVIFNQFLGLTYTLVFENIDFFMIEFNGNSIKLNDSYFKSIANNWGADFELPDLPLKTINIKCFSKNIKTIDEKLPILFGADVYEPIQGRVELDIFGSIFFMLSRIEEYTNRNKDEFGRFKTVESFAFKAGFYSRPIVDEYIEVLWYLLVNHLHVSARKKREKSILVTCDVDIPYSPSSYSFVKGLKTAAADIIKRKNFKLSILNLANTCLSPLGIYKFDPNDSFEFIMSINERFSNKVAFYFITDSLNNKMDGDVFIHNKRIKDLLSELSVRGHEVGIHPSYETYLNEEQLSKEVLILKEKLKSIDLPVDAIGGRQHYLRWDAGVTPGIWNNCGLVYDSSIGFPDIIGFRCGTSHSYTMYDLKNRKSLRLIQRPLILMDSTIFGYLGLELNQDTLLKVRTLKERCFLFDGCFTLLWHNNYLVTNKQKYFYSEIIKSDSFIEKI
mgnify:CR=1 FL=1